jgi:integrase
MQPHPTGDATPENRRMIPVKGHPGVYRKGGRYVVKWRHRGQQRKRSCRTLTEAKRVKGEIDAGATQPVSREPFRSYAARWLDTYTGRTAHGVSPSTQASYRDALQRVAIPYFATTRLDAIDPPALRAYVQHLADQGYAPATVRRYYAPVRALLATAHEDGALRANPAAGVRVIVPGHRERKPRRLTADQTRRLLAAMPADHADLAYLLAATGLRIGEALRARWADLGHDDHGRPVLTIPQSKTRAGERTVPLTAGTLRRLTLRRARAHAQPADAMFPSDTGTDLDARNWRRRVFKPAAVAAGVPDATPHMLRHGVASLMAEKGYGAAEIAAHLGHADGGVLALRTYIHPEGHAAPDFIDDVLTGS